MTADPQREAVYRWQAHAVVPALDAGGWGLPLGADLARRLAARAFALAGLPPPRVEPSRAAFGLWDGPLWRILLPHPDGYRVALLLHEASHGIADTTAAAHRRPPAGHGPAFAATYCRLLTELTPLGGDYLTETMRRFGVRCD